MAPGHDTGTIEYDWTDRRQTSDAIEIDIAAIRGTAEWTGTVTLRRDGKGVVLTSPDIEHQWPADLIAFMSANSTDLHQEIVTGLWPTIWNAMRS